MLDFQSLPKRLVQNFLHDRKFRNTFLITSGGCAATRWIGGAINMHPSITCTGGVGPIEETTDFNRSVSDEGSERVAKYNIDHFAAAAPDPVFLVDVFDEIRRHRTSKFIGNIHFHTLGSLESHRKIERIPANVRIANVVRHPVTRLETHFNHWKRQYEVGPHSKKLFELCFSGFVDRYKNIRDIWDHSITEWSLQPGAQIFAYSIFDTMSVFEGDFQTEIGRNVPHFRMEDLKTKPEEFNRLVAFISRDEIQFGADLFSRVYSSDGLQQGRFSKRKLLEADDQWRAWAPWQKSMAKSAFEHVGLIPSLSSLGYDFCFMREKED
jgi:hypothetical protein